MSIERLLFLAGMPEGPGASRVRLKEVRAVCLPREMRESLGVTGELERR